MCVGLPFRPVTCAHFTCLNLGILFGTLLPCTLVGDITQCILHYSSCSSDTAYKLEHSQHNARLSVELHYS